MRGVPLGVIVTFAVGCAPARPSAPPPTASPLGHTVLIKDGAEGRRIDQSVGKRVRLEGVVTNTKQPQIAGVDVEEPTEAIPGSESRHVTQLRNKPAWAEGVIERTIVRPEDVDNTVANRGAG